LNYFAHDSSIIKGKWPVFKHILRNGVSVLPKNKNKKRGFKRIYGGLVSSVGEVASPWSVADNPMAVSASVGYAVAVNAIVCYWLWIATFAGFLASDKAAHSISYRIP
jgi:hypothetical protein